MSADRAPGTPQRDPLTQLVMQCTLYVEGERPGTGVFVAPSVVATCTHVVGRALSRPQDVMLVMWQGKGYSVSPKDVLCSLQEEDLTLLRVRVEEHPCVLLDPTIVSGETLFAHGHPVIEAGKGPSADDLTAEVVGATHMNMRHWMLKFHAPDVPEGFSGAGLLNRTRQSVCGLVAESRGAGRGGRAVPASVILARMPPDVHADYEQFHAHDHKWKAACAGGAPVRRRAAMPRPPPFWPHLCDRWEQGAVLSRALDEHRGQRARRPFVFITHGDERELHDGFRERLRHEDLVRYVTPGPRNVPIELFTLSLSLSGGGPSLEDQVKAGLAGRLQCSPGRVPAMLMQRIDVALLYASIGTSEWGREGERRLKEFLSLWSDWPDVGAGQTLLVLLSVQYECTNPDDENARLTYPQRRRQMMNLLHSLEKPEMRAEFAGIGYRVLPELSPPGPSHAKAVFEVPSVNPFVQGVSRTLWEEWVDRVFRGRDRMRMKYLRPALNHAMEALLDEENAA